jgi:hypothetical protein
MKGDKYTGEFFEDKAHGMGVLTKANGEIFKGRFEDDEFVDE